MPSTAFTTLSDRLKDVDELMYAHQVVGGPRRGRRFDVEGLNRAAVLMLTAHFEGYIEDLMQEALGGINPDLNAKPLIGNFHNPWPDKIDELFAFLGMDKPSKSISWRRAGNPAVRKHLEDLVRLRNQLAHGTMGVSVRKMQVVRLRKYVEGFAQGFDRLVCDQVHKLTGKYPWKI